MSVHSCNGKNIFMLYNTSLDSGCLTGCLCFHAKEFMRLTAYFTCSLVFSGSESSISSHILSSVTQTKGVLLQASAVSIFDVLPQYLN